MKAVSGKDFAAILERHGWELRRIAGSHYIYTRPGSDIRISVPVHGNRDLRRGLQRHLMKLAGIDENDL